MTVFIAAATLNFAAAVMHLAVIVGGAPWYRFFGAGERMASMAEAGRLYPAILTSGIVAVLTLWGLYALQGGGYISGLPGVVPVLWAITGVYTLRALYPLVMAPFVALFRTPFMVWSSLIVAGYAIVHWWAVLTLPQ